MSALVGHLCEDMKPEVKARPQETGPSSSSFLIIIGDSSLQISNNNKAFMTIVCRLGEGPSCQGFYIEHGAVCIFS